MQLKLKRSQRMGGVLSKAVLFCIDARVEFASEERANLVRYKLFDEVIYNSEAQLRLLEKSASQIDGSVAGNFKSIATSLWARTKLHVTVASLERGQHVECKSLEELLSAEEAILQACQNLKGYLETARSFDGREVLVDFSADKPEVIAHAVSPEPMLAVPMTDARLLPPPASVPTDLEASGARARDEDWAYPLAASVSATISGQLDTPAKQALVIGLVIAAVVCVVWSLMA